MQLQLDLDALGFVAELPTRCCGRPVHRGVGLTGSLASSYIGPYAECDVCLVHYWTARP